MKKFYVLAMLCIFAKTDFAQCGMTINVSKTNASCNGLNDGSAAVSVTGGAGSYVYNWSNGSGNVTTVPNLAVGSYTVYVTDAAPCTDSAVFVITQPPAINIVTTTQPASCGQSNGFACASASGGAPGYTYIWAPSGNTSSCASGMPAGTYTISITDANGCIASNLATIGNIPPPTLSMNSGSTQCGACNGTAVALPNGGTAPYAYSWSGPLGFFSTVFQPTGLCAGTYTCMVTDANGCQVVNAVTVSQSSTVTGIGLDLVPAACGQNDGSITIDSVVGGIAPFTYSINTGNFSAMNVFSNLGAGTYTVSVMDSSGCFATYGATLNNSNFSVQLNPVMPSCNLCDGTISTTITGGSAPYAYSWSNNATTSSINNLCAGNYQLMVTDSGGCLGYADTSLVPANAPVIQVDTVVNIACSGSNTGSITVSVTGGTGAIAYSWNTAPPQTTPVISNLSSGNYVVTATDAVGCSSSQTVYVANANSIYVYATQVNAVNCGAPGSVTVNVFGGTPPYQYAWGNGTVSSVDSMGGFAPGIYMITVTDINGCTGNGSVNIGNYCMNIIKGRVYNDINQNCVQDAGEPGLPWRSLNASPGYNYGYTDANGDYMILTPNMNNTVTVYNYYSTYFSPTCPATGSSSVNFTVLGSTSANNDFGYYANPNYFDLDIHPGWTSANPGFQKKYWCLYNNNSLTSQNAVLSFIYDPVLQLDSITQGGVHYPLQHRIEWTLNNLAPGSYWNWSTKPEVYFTVPVSVSITDSLHTYFEITPIAGDAYPANNTLDIIEPVTGSRDPNEKSVIPKGEGPNGNILQSDSTLLYTVHFQNNGNDTALTVVVVDTLSQFLDPSTIVPGASSHSYTFDLSGQGIMTFTFSQILLPDSLTDEPASNGYFNYTIKQKANNPYGSVINNTAYIYFDFNSAVVTNTTVNTIVAPVGIIKYSDAGKDMLLYPNPTANSFMLQYEAKEEGTLKLEIYNLMGELIKSQQLISKQKGKNLERIDVNGLSSGIYLVKLYCNGEQVVRKLVIDK
ncbi:MAG: T9SS type A sorting domain-containing protein [Bacteroidia bacterium]